MGTINSMVDGNAGPPQRPVASTHDGSAAPLVKAGGSKQADSRPTATGNPDVGLGFAQAGATSVLSEAGVGVGRQTKTAPGGPGNTSGTDGDIGFPRGGDGKGDGRPSRPATPPAPKSRPRTPYDPVRQGSVDNGKVTRMPRARRK
jgi:hypothetical protein